MKYFILILIFINTYSAGQSSSDFKDWVTSLAIDSSGNIYAGTNSNGSGIFLSTDHGNHWQQTKMRYGVNSIAVTKSGAVVSFSFGYSYGRYLFRLSDQGSSLDSIFLNFTPAFIKLGENGLLYAADFNGGIYFSGNEGDSWDTVETNWIAPLVLPVITATKNGILLLGTKTGVWRSPDNGMNWEGGYIPNHDSLAVQHIIVVNDSTIYAGAFESMGINSNEIYVSSDTGKSWNLMAMLDFNLDAMTIDPSGKIYIGNSGGVYCITPAGEISHLGLDSVIMNEWGVRSLAVLNQDTIFAGAWGGVYRTTNSGVDWELLNEGLISDTLQENFTNPLPFGYYISSGVIADDGSFVVGTDSAGIFRSVDKGKTWLSTNLTLPQIRSVVHDSLGNLFAASLKNGVYKSSNNGSSWALTADGGLSNPEVYTLSCNRSYVPRYGYDSTHMIQEDYCYAGTEWGIYDYYINSNFWSPAGGSNSIAAIEPLGSRDAVCSTPDGTVYLSPGGWLGWEYKSNVGGNVADLVRNNSDFVFAVGSNGVFRSTNKGATWEQKNSGILDTNLISAATDKKVTLFIGSQSGDIYKSTDSGESWIRTARFDYPVRNILVENENHKIYAAVGARLFVIINNPPTEVNSSAIQDLSFLLNQNYPNPFNPATAISFSIPRRQFVTLKIFDSIGREVAALISEEKAPGKYTLQWNASGLSSGVYFYRLQAGAYNQTKKLILLK
ncbi:MAG: T9SS type A sorting domain-containing protein [Ignavibacteria bacterium]